MCSEVPCYSGLVQLCKSIAVIWILQNWIMIKNANSTTPQTWVQYSDRIHKARNGKDTWETNNATIQYNTKIQRYSNTVRGWRGLLRRVLPPTNGLIWQIHYVVATHSTLCCTLTYTLCIQSAIYSRIWIICENKKGVYKTQVPVFWETREPQSYASPKLAGVV